MASNELELVDRGLPRDGHVEESETERHGDLQQYSPSS